LELGVVLDQVGCRDLLEPQLVARIRRVRDELAQEDLLMRVHRVRDEVEDLADFGFEAAGFGGGVHGRWTSKWGGAPHLGSSAGISRAAKTKRPREGGRSMAQLEKPRLTRRRLPSRSRSHPDP